MSPQKYATLIVDMQNDFVADDGVLPRAGMNNQSAKAIVPRVRELVEFSRARGIPVIWAKMIYDSAADVGLLIERSAFYQHGGLRRGTWGAELVDGLEVQPGDYVIEKKRFSAFFNTPLDDLLRELGVTHLLVAGVRTDFCVESTIRDAFFRDYHIIMVKDCVAGYFQDLHENAIKTMGTVFARVMDSDEVKQSLA
jgi:ureidoacrylate peracid hydrolase